AKKARHSSGRWARARNTFGTKPVFSATASIRSRMSSGTSSRRGTGKRLIGGGSLIRSLSGRPPAPQRPQQDRGEQAGAAPQHQRQRQGRLAYVDGRHADDRRPAVAERARRRGRGLGGRRLGGQRGRHAE